MLLWIKECTLTSFVVLGVRSEGNTPKKWRTNCWFFFNDNAPTRRLVLFEDFLAKINETTLEQPPHSPDLASAEFYPFLEWNYHWRDRSFVTILTCRMRRQSKKAFTKWLPGMFLTPLQSLTEVYICFKWLCCLVSLRNKVILGHFETTTYLQLRICCCVHFIT